MKPEDTYSVARLSNPLHTETSSHVKEDSHAPVIKSLFTHEAEALLAIERHVKTHGLGETLTNLEVHDPQSNRYFEVDLVLVSRFRIYVVELKHWSGRIEIRPNNWEQNNSFSKADPHKSNGFKAKLLRGIYQRQFPSFPDLYFESVVVLTNPEVEAIGCASAKTTNNNPTFDGLDRFFQYLSNQRQAHVAKLSDNQCRGFADYVRKLNVGGRPRDFVFPGYEIVERLYQFEDRAEVVARRTDLRHRKMSRLRIFFLQSGDQRAKEKATATLNAVELIGEHPNILKVWDIPNENNYLVEGSDWSETGTLRDCLDRSRPMKPQAALAVAIGLAMGLKAAHAQLVVHRSLSPENVLMVNDIPKLMNFDLSFQLEDNRLTVIPDVSQLKRSPYIAPEIYKGGITPEATADLFSLGVILYEMLVGERPFGCSTDLELSHGKLREEQLHKVRIVDGVDERLVGLINCLVRESPASRLSSADSVIEQLSECLDGPVDEAPAEANRLLEANERHGLYEIVEFIGHGAEAQIYKAAGVGGKPVLLKLFKRDVLLQRVVSEYRFAGTVRHPSLVRVDSYSQWSDGRYFIAFDWLPGGNLREEISKGNHPDFATFQRGALQLLDALTVLHSNQENDTSSPILHNDIKPENILLAGERLVLIDFGAASEPRVGTYEGTEGYVPPDLRLGQDRDFSISGDLYGLAVTLYEWLIGKRPSSEDSNDEPVSSEIKDWLLKGCAPKAEDRFASVDEMRSALLQALNPPALNLVPTEIDLSYPLEPPPAECASDQSTGILAQPADEILSAAADHARPATDPNPFVPYLNSLHSGTAASENALAESQALNPFFKFIHVAHPLAHLIEEVLRGEEKCHVILTGHAGDGKTTISVEVLKRLRGLPNDAELPGHLQPREDAGDVALIKDFSEWSPAGRADLLKEMLEEREGRFLLVSNTGTLLETFKTHEEGRGGDFVAMESELLAAMSSSEPAEFSVGDTRFTLINVAMMDNLALARKILERMLASERWKACEDAACRTTCPIHQNVTLLQSNQALALDRLFLAYRRIYEYGTRLTLRQLTGHLAYLITAGLDYRQIDGFAMKAKRPALSKFLFFNRFFGDDGVEQDPVAAPLRAIQTVRQQAFGSEPCPAWERRMWLRSRGATFQLEAAAIPDDFSYLRDCAAGIREDENIQPEHARMQVRRAVFFLHEFGGEEGDQFLRKFLRSNMVLDFVRWQQADACTLSLLEGSRLKSRIMHVLQEHFTGVRLPEGGSPDKQLLVTLSRRSGDIRQSAQIVLATYREDEFEVLLRSESSAAGGIRRNLFLVGPSNGRSDIQLELPLPFLDYVMLRNHGEIGQTLQASYVDRLERFKGLLVSHAGKSRPNDIMLVRLKTNHTFRRHVFAVHDGRLEVTDA